ncbi:phage tail tape measure protein [Streptococcus sp. 11273D007BT]
MSTPLGAMRVELELDSSKFASNMNASKKAVNYFKAEARALDAAMKSSGNTMTLLGAKQKTLTQALDKQGDVLSRLKKNFATLDVGSKKWESAAIEIERENAKLEQLRAELGRVETALVKVHAQNSMWGKLGTSLTNFGEGAKNVGSVLTNMGNAMMPVSTALSTGFMLATKKALDFGGEMQTVKALLSDTITDSKTLDKTTALLGDNSKKWAKQFGISTSDINLGMQEVIKAGFDANQTIGAMPAILTASKATGEEFGTVMGATTSILSQFGLITSDTNQMLKNTNRVTDSLSFVANKTKAGFSDMGLAMEYVGPVANSVGMSLEETAAAIGILSNAGIDGQKAGTALRGALSKLLDPSKENAAAFEQLGFSAEEFRSGAIKLPDVIDRIRKNTEGMTDAQKAAIIAQAFGVEAQSGINALVSAGADELNKLTDATKGAAGYTDELYKKMSGSGKSAVERFRSSLEVLQITIGEKLLPVLTPIIEKVTEWVEKFAEADETTQKFWMAIAGGLAVSYPLLNFAGNAVSAIGNVSSAFGFLSTKMSEVLARKAVTSTLSSVATSATTTGTAMAGAGSSTSAFGTALSFLGNPIGAVIAGSLALAGRLIYLNNKKDEAKRKAQEWGTILAGETKQSLEIFKGKVDETKTALGILGGEGTVNVDKLKSSLSSLFQEIQQGAQASNQRIEEMAKKWGLSDEQVQRAKDHNQRMVDNAQTMTNQISAIYEKHNGDVSQLTSAEKGIVENNMRELINTKLDLLDLSNSQEKAVRQAFSDEMVNLNETQIKKTSDGLKAAMKAEQETYKQQQAELKQLWEEGALTKAEYNQKKEQLELEHNTTMDTLGQKFIEAQRALGEKQGENAEDVARKTKTALEKMGLDYEELANKVDSAVKKGVDNNHLLAQSTKDMTAEQQQANTLWNSLTYDEKKAEVKSNAIEEVMKSAESEQGWNNLMFMMKEANVTSNARMEIGNALVESGRWNSMTPEEKKLVVNGQAGLQAILESKTQLDTWNGLSPEMKELLANNSDFTSKADIAKTTLENWNALSPQAKELLAKDLASPNAHIAQAAIDTLQGKEVDILANDVTTPGVASANRELNGLPWAKDVSISASDNTGSGKASAQSNIDSVKQTTASPINAVDNTSWASASAMFTINNVKQNHPAAINAANKTQSQASAASTTINNVKQNRPADINARNNVGSTVGDVLNSLAQIPSVKWISILAKKVGLEKGTNFHEGGLAVVNDQKGPLYKELVTLPTGESFIPEGRDVLLPLPRGSKVLPARKTRDLMRMRGVPRYADGVGIPADAAIFQSMDKIQQRVENRTVINNDNSDVVFILRQILDALTNNRHQIERGETGVYLDMERVGTMIDKYQEANKRRTKRMRGELI